MYIEISKKDIERIAADKSRPEMELALAKKCLALYEKLGKINDEKNSYFETLYSISVRLDKIAGESLRNKRIVDMKKQSEADMRHATECDRIVETLTA